MRIVIPSYKRAATLRDKTLSQHIPYEMVTVFVADKDEYRLYKDTLRPDTYADLIIGKPGLCDQRNFIRAYYPAGEPILSMDDDLAGIYQLEAGKLKTVLDLAAIMRRGFALCDEHKTTLWGIYAVNNAFFMRQAPSFELCYICGYFYGFYNDHSTAYQTTLEDKEDFERSILHYLADGALVRLNDIACKTNYYKEAGGMQVTRTKDRVMESALYLLRKHPDLCRLNTGKSNQEFVEIKLKDRRK